MPGPCVAVILTISLLFWAGPDLLHHTSSASFCVQALGLPNLDGVLLSDVL